MFTSFGSLIALYLYTTTTFYFQTAQALPRIDDASASKPNTFTLRPNDVSQRTLSAKNSGRGQTGKGGSSFIHLQMNLCNSGWAKCYKDGNAVLEGANWIYDIAPNTVSINEICQQDIPKLQDALAEAWPKDKTYSVFMPAIYASNNTAYRCRNQKSRYGSVVMGRGALSKAYGGLFTSQAAGGEHRIFTCAAGSGHFACATHLASGAKPTALAQCKALMFDAVPYLKSLAGSSGHTIVGGDFNLKYDKGDANNVQNCVPNGYTRKGDGDVQHVIWSNDFKFKDTTKLAMSYTDHSGWEIELTT